MRQGRFDNLAWESKVRLSESFFNEIVSHPVPLNMNTLKALKRSPLGLDLPWTAPGRSGTLAPAASLVLLRGRERMGRTAPAV